MKGAQVCIAEYSRVLGQVAETFVTQSDTARMQDCEVECMQVSLVFTNHRGSGGAAIVQLEA